MAKLIDFRYENKLGLTETARQHPAAVRRALNRVAASVRTEISRAVRDEYNIKKRDLDPNIKVTNAQGNRLASLVVIKARRLPLASFAARFLKRAKAVAVRIKRTGGKDRVQGGFIVPTQYNKHVTVRKVKGGGREQPDIKFLYTIGAADMAGTKETEKRAQAKADERLPIEIDEQLKAIVKGWAPSQGRRS